ncbi:Bicarbonate transport system permease protein CmpB [Corynebacterium occultum]|uniref:Bicarbonate transport system permease protein CmpB n=1 Tax=Corynebacterium occultum TaxID=2675219 RepID=A0A6B8VRN0_9CORY|nr:ABC transporter permease subunit [Corynebacterium occultum]QGU08222.1 Bicarbonate transport system permease protein CmpB [Corynebacterium occultum]
MSVLAPASKPTTESRKYPGTKPKAKRDKTSSQKVMGPRILAILILVVGWQLLTMTPLVDTDSLPSPSMIFSALLGLWGSAIYWSSLGNTLLVWALGLGLSALIGIPTGLLIGASLRATQSTRWVVDFFRTIPTIALLPLVLLLFGATMKMSITMIVLSAVWPLLIQSMYAAKQVEPLHKWVMAVFRISLIDRLKFLWAPSVALFVSTGMRLAATMALLMTIAAEYLGGAPGLGLQLSLNELAFRRPEVFAYALTAGMIGVLINLFLVQLQRRFLWWHPIIRGERS